MKPIKFIFTDMDGTLLNDDKVLPKDFYQVFEQLEQHNILFSAASGRQYYSLEQTFFPIKDKVVFIAENGTLVMYQGKEIDSTIMDKKDACAIISSLRNIDDTFIVLCGKSSAYVETQNAKALAEMSKYYHCINSVSDLLTVEDEIIKIAALHFESTEKHVYPVVAPLYAKTHQVVVSGQIWLDFMHKDASKGAAIRKLQQYFGVSFEQCMSFGDYLNDIEMLKETYYSYAMENAHPQIKALARFTAPSNQQEGVMTVIKEKVLPQK